MKDIALTIIAALAIYVMLPRRVVLLMPDPKQWFSILRWKTLREQRDTLEERNALAYFGRVRRATAGVLDHLDPDTNPHPKVPLGVEALPKAPRTPPPPPRPARRPPGAHRKIAVEVPRRQGPGASYQGDSAGVAGTSGQYASAQPQPPGGRHRRPPWDPAPRPDVVAPTMILRMAPPAAPAQPPPPPAAVRPPRPQTAPPPQPAEPRAWEPGDEDPPTIVRGLRAVMADDLDPYLDALPRYAD